jgi:hypothetical protein
MLGKSPYEGHTFDKAGCVHVNRNDFTGFTIDYSKPPVGYYMDVNSAIKPFDIPLYDIPKHIQILTSATGKHSWEEMVFRYRLENGV